MKQPKLGAHIPWAQVANYLEPVLAMELVPEIAIKGPELDTLDSIQLQQAVQTLASAGVRPRIHAPFFDLNPGALDPLIRQATRQRLEQTLTVAGQLNASLVVIHPGFDKWRYPNLNQAWLNHAMEFFPPLLEMATRIDCLLAIENIYEETPQTLVHLVNGLDSRSFGHCFDAGHWHLFGKRPMFEWLQALGPKLFHLHLHDNHGRADEHLPVGAGTIDFTPLQKHLCQVAIQPSITLEAHSPAHLQESLQQVRSLLD